MTPTQVALIQASFEKVVPIADDAAALFYERLFKIAPDVKRLFKGDMVSQGHKLMATLGTVVRSLDDFDAILPAAKALAIRHADYGAGRSITSRSARLCSGPCGRVSATHLRRRPLWPGVRPMIF